MADRAHAVCHGFKVDQVMLIGSSRGSRWPVVVVGGGTVAGIPITHASGGALHALEHHGVRHVSSRIRCWVAIGALEGLASTGLIFVVGVVFFVLHSESLCFVNKRSLFFFI